MPFYIGMSNLAKRWAVMGSNHRPRLYQRRALPLSQPPIASEYFITHYTYSLDFEAWAGIAPVRKSFADSRLTTWLPGPCLDFSTKQL